MNARTTRGSIAVTSPVSSSGGSSATIPSTPRTRTHHSRIAAEYPGTERPRAGADRIRELAEQAELKQSFLNNMSHEIRTPLNAIVGFSDMLANEPEFSDEERQEFVDIINTNTKLLLKLVGDVLELSRIESGNLSFIFQRRACVSCSMTSIRRIACLSSRRCSSSRISLPKMCR